VCAFNRTTFRVFSGTELQSLNCLQFTLLVFAVCLLCSALRWLVWSPPPKKKRVRIS